jgi:hypothetical protein
VRMRRATLTAVLVDRESSLDSAGRAAEGLVHRVPQNAFGQGPVEAGEALGGPIVHREDEPAVDRVAEASGILNEGPADGCSSPRKARYRGPIPYSSRRRPCGSPSSQCAM